jgi:hypothetical protein
VRSHGSKQLVLKLSHGSASGRSITSLGWIYRSIFGHKILTANHVLSLQQRNPSHHLMGVVYVQPQTLPDLGPVLPPPWFLLPAGYLFWGPRTGAPCGTRGMF